MMKKVYFMCICKTFDISLFRNVLSNIIKVNNIDDADIVVLGYAVLENDYNYICNNIINFKKIYGYITEPIEFLTPYFYKLYTDNVFFKVFGSIDNNINSVKYPLYLMYYNYTDKLIYENINKNVKNMSIDEITNKKFATLISRHDNGNTRSKIYHALTEIKQVDCPSRLFRNMRSKILDSIGNSEFIKKYIFNICAENYKTNVKGYITEKLLLCCLGYAIPIYYGGFDEIDEKIFNKKRIIFFDPFDNNSINLTKNKVNELINNYDLLESFYKQNIFKDTAYETIMNMEQNVISLFS